MIRLHDLRHTHATLLLKAGVPLKVVSKRLGHATSASTMAVYQHVLPGMQAEAVEVFAELIASGDTIEGAFGRRSGRRLRLNQKSRSTRIGSHLLIRWWCWIPAVDEAGSQRRRDGRLNRVPGLNGEQH